MIVHTIVTLKILMYAATVRLSNMGKTKETIQVVLTKLMAAAGLYTWGHPSKGDSNSMTS